MSSLFEILLRNPATFPTDLSFCISAIVLHITKSASGDSKIVLKFFACTNFGSAFIIVISFNLDKNKSRLGGETVGLIIISLLFVFCKMS
jgi:hypothetical protein